MYTATKLNQVLYPQSKNPISFQQGLEFQDFVVEQFAKQGFYIQLHSSKKYQFERGESVQRCEIKLDNRCTETGRLSIEIAERTRTELGWTPSGIYRGDNTIFYVQGNQSLLFLFDKKVLRRYHSFKLKQAFEESPRETPTVRKFYMPFADAADYCIFSMAIE